VNLVGRVGGRFTFRLLLQPTVATFFAIRAGLKDARTGRAPYGWAVLSDSTKRRNLLSEGWADVAKVFAIAVIIDLVYQNIELRWFYPEESLIVAASLALVPYLLLRSPTNRIARRCRGTKKR
jgi:hypothetical protein